MKLRELEIKDAKYMLEWMHDSNVCDCLGKDFKSMTIDNCKAFIENARTDDKNRHLAIVDDNDEYMGTISLKEIDRVNKRAEYAIACRTKAIGHGFAAWATKELFTIAKDGIGLDLIYLNVYKSNIRAQKMYQKVGFVNVPQPHYTDVNDDRLIWFEKDL